jgi:rod shape-determining protein MreC
MPALGSGDRREITVLAVCLALSALLLIVGGRLDTRWAARLEAALLWPANQARDFVASVTLGRLENRSLKSEVLRLRTEAILLRQAAAEALRLRRVLHFAQPRAPVLLAARVVAVWGEPWPQFIRLSVGREDGVRVGQPVVAPEGLVGRIAAVEPHAARAAVLTDPALAVACEVVPQGARGVLRFRADRRPGLYLSWVPLTDTVRVGEEVATSGLSALFPRGLPVGTVARVGRDPNGLVQEIEVRPYAALGRVREVFVVVDTEALEPWSPAATDSATADSAADSTAAVPTAADTAAAGATRPDSLGARTGVGR